MMNLLFSQVMLGDLTATATPLETWVALARSWPAPRMYIDQTVGYATDILNGDYAAAIDKYDEAFAHMMVLADILTDGIIAAFPDRSGY